MRIATVSTLTALTLAICGSVAQAQPSTYEPTEVIPPPPPVREGDPPLSGGQIAGELLLGGLASTGGILLGGYLGGQQSDGCGEEFCQLGAILIGAQIGYIVAAPLGVYAAGTDDEVTGSLGATYLGSVLGGASAWLIAFGIGDGIDSDFGESLVAMSLLGGPLIGSTIGFNLSRHYRETDRAPRLGGLVMLDEKGARLGVPLPAVAPTKAGVSAQLSLVTGRF